MIIVETQELDNFSIFLEIISPNCAHFIVHIMDLKICESECVMNASYQESTMFCKYESMHTCKQFLLMNTCVQAYFVKLQKSLGKIQINSIAIANFLTEQFHIYYQTYVGNFQLIFPQRQISYESHCACYNLSTCSDTSDNLLDSFCDLLLLQFFVLILFFRENTED